MENKDSLKIHYPHYKIWIVALIGALFLPVAKGQFYYGTRMEFGKNRVQYDEFDWTYYRFDLYDVYFYRGNDELADQVARMAKKERAQIENYLDAPSDERIQILLFNNLSDLKQTNLNESSDETYNTVGITRSSGNRLFLHFNGSYADLRKQLRAGLAEMTVKHMISGDFTQNIANSTLLNLPEWYVQGLISFIGKRWNAEIDNRVRDGFYSKRYQKINTLTGDDARLAGHSLWYFVTQKYGDKVLKNIVYMSILNRDVENGFTYILGVSLDDVIANWRQFYQNRYELKATKSYFKEKPLIKARNNHRIVRMQLSPNGRYLAYVRQKFSRYKIFIKDLQTGKRTRVVTGGYRIAQNTDYSFPLLSWHPNSEMLAFITEEEGFVQLNFYNREKEEFKQKTLFQFDKVTAFQYSQDGRRFVVAAHNNGQSDIYIYTILNTKTVQITNDNYDDVNPTFMMDDRRVAFSSNRVVDSMYPGQRVKEFTQMQRDIFSAPAQENKDTIKLWRMTNSPDVNEVAIQRYEPGYLSFMSDRSGRYNQHLLKIDSAIAYVDTTVHYNYTFQEYRATNYDMGLLDQAHHSRSEKTYELVVLDERYKIYEKPYRSPQQQTPLREEAPTAPIGQELGADKPAGKSDSDGDSTDNKREAPAGENMPLYYPGTDENTFAVDIDNYRFESDAEAEKEKQQKEQKSEKVDMLEAIATNRPLATREQQASKAAELEIPPKRQYFLTFFKDQFDVGFDAIFDNNQYQKFTGFVSSDLLNAGFNANFKVGALELMKDFRLIGGVQTSFQPLAGTSLAPNAEFLVGFSDKRKRLNLNHTYYRRSQVQFLTNTRWLRLISNQVMTEAIWPFNPVSSIHGSLGLRHDRTITLSRESQSLGTPEETETYGISRLAYVYDNSRKLGINLYSGLRFKIFTEYYKNFNISPSGMHAAGIDARYYQVIHRNLIWANRVAYGASFGPEKLIYIMGGTDNAFSPNLEPTTPIAEDNNYIFQTLATNMRGFYQNVRNGNQFAVINSEIRWPFLSYLFRKPIRSDFFKNLQVVGFYDVGTAWNGSSPWDPANAINTKSITRGESLEIILDTQKNPIVMGYGAGVRSRLLGYFVRLDWAWGVEDGVILPAEFYISLSTDF